MTNPSTPTPRQLARAETRIALAITICLCIAVARPASAIEPSSTAASQHPGHHAVGQPHSAASDHHAGQHDAAARWLSDPHGVHAAMAHALGHLELEAAQAEAVHELHQRFTSAMESARLEESHHAQLIARQIHSQTLDVDAVRESAARLGLLRQHALIRSAECLHELRTLLSDEQLEQLHELHLHLDELYD